MPVFSKRELEGYLEIQTGAGITPEVAATVPGAVPMPKDLTIKSATINCSHCKAMVVLNPLRTRERGYCPCCDHYLCDGCTWEYHRSKVCVPFSKVRDDFIDAVANGRDPKPITDAFMKRKGAIHYG